MALLLQILCLLSVYILVVNAATRGTYSAWTAWSECTATCDGGKKTKTRTCDASRCIGESIIKKNCNTDPCVVASVWLPWGNWTDCPVTCGGGTQSRGRECDGTACIGDATETQYCNDFPCDDWECPDGSDYAGFCVLPVPLAGHTAAECAADHYCHPVTAANFSASVCCERITCATTCGSYIYDRDCWCDAACTYYGDCCPEYGNDCSVFRPGHGLGDPHFETLDGKRFDYQGNCEYILMTNNCPWNPMNFYTVYIKAIHKYGQTHVTWTTEGRVVIDGMEIKLGPGSTVEDINGPITTPWSDPGPPFVNIVRAGWTISITTGYGFKVTWDGFTLRVYVTDDVMGEVCGLVGNYTGVQSDDFVKFNGDVMPFPPTQAQIDEFGDSWAVPGLGCLPAPNKRSAYEENKRNLYSDQALATCTALFNGGNIPTCHADSPPEGLIDNCALDLSMSLPEDEDAGCPSVASYVKECIGLGHPMDDWRTGTVCEKPPCVNGKVYTTCGPSCPATCQIPHPQGTCFTDDCNEGCFCAGGQVLNAADQCVDISACGVYFGGQLYPFGAVLPNGATASCDVSETTLCIGCRYFEVVGFVGVTWQDAKAACEADGGRLAKLETEAIDTQVRNFITHNYFEYDVAKGFWIGLNDIDSDGSFVWSDGEAMTWSNWGPGEPNNNMNKDSSGQDCVQLRKKRGLLWDDDYCGAEKSRTKGYICEYTDTCV